MHVARPERRKPERLQGRVLSASVLEVRVFALESPARLFRVQMLDRACK